MMKVPPFRGTLGIRRARALSHADRGIRRGREAGRRRRTRGICLIFRNSILFLKAPVPRAPRGAAPLCSLLARKRAAGLRRGSPRRYVGIVSATNFSSCYPAHYFINHVIDINSFWILAQCNFLHIFFNHKSSRIVPSTFSDASDYPSANFSIRPIFA